MDAKELFDRFGENVAVGRAFGTPFEKDGSTMIPVAIVLGGGGSGSGRQGDAELGEGGGFGGIVYPIGVYVIRDGDAKFVPSVNASRLAASAITLFALVVSRALGRRRRSRRPRSRTERPGTRLQDVMQERLAGAYPHRHRGEVFRLRRRSGRALPVEQEGHND
jgi:uncharacterized spore protein YtfJ